MTALLKRAGELIARATPGPWERHDTEAYAEIRSGVGEQAGAVALVAHEADADLIALAPTLAARVVELEGALTVAEESLDQLLDDMGDEGKCVCQQAKEEAILALATVRAALPATEGGE